MRRPSRISLLIVLLVLGPTLYLSISIDESYTTYLIPIIVVGVSIYVLSPQLDWWWYSQFPLKPNPEVVSYFQQNFKGFALLPEKNQNEILHQYFLLELSKNFISMGGDEKIPDGFKLIILTSLLECTYKKKDYFLKDFENIVLYAHSFPSPRWPQRLHLSETEMEDKVFIFSLPAVLKGNRDPKSYFPITTYEFCKALLYQEKIALNDLNWESLNRLVEQVMGYTIHQIAEYINLPADDLSIEAVILTAQIHFPNALEQYAKDWFNWAQSILDFEKNN